MAKIQINYCVYPLLTANHHLLYLFQMDLFQFTTKSNDEILKQLNVDFEQGLPHQEAKKRLEEFGPNEIAGEEISWWKILFRQFQSPFIYLLAGAMVLALLLGQIIDSSMILLFIVINSTLGFFQEFRSEKTLQLLKKYVASYAKVIRNGKEQAILREEVVPGDIIILEAGDKIPADIRFLETYNSSFDESILTGESVPVQKTSDALKKEPKELYQAENIGFSGTTIVNDKAKAVVLATGKKTAIGKITRLTVETKRSSTFEKGIAKFSSFILKLVIITLVFVFLANLLIKGSAIDNIIEFIIFSIALAVSVIPEALPVVTTFSLSRGALHLAKHKVVVRRLSAIEELGDIEVLCTDKTGTLTENKLTVAEIYPESSPDTLLYANLASSSAQKHKLEPFDIALWNALPKERRETYKNYQRTSDAPFEPKHLRNAVIVEKDGLSEIITRGAPEVIFQLCPCLSSEKQSILQKWIAEKGNQGQRTIALAKKDAGSIDANMLKDSQAFQEKGFEFLGVIAFVDPIKPSAFQAVKQAKKLGVVIKIITGDSKEVAGSVAYQIGLVSSADETITGQELDSLTISKQHEAVEQYSVFARISPEQKYKIIQLLEEKHGVGFLGEGINDTPALKIADVSLVVQSASDIARETADFVILQKDLKVIIDGIKEGRKVFVNTVKYIKTTLASNFGNFYAVALSSLFINFLPMLPIQILLLNLLSDFPMIAISTDNVDESEVIRPKKYNVREVTFVATILGIVSTVFDFVFFGLFFRTSPGILQTNWFIGSILTELALIFSLRTKSFFLKSQGPSIIVSFLAGFAAIATIIIPFTFFGQTLFHFVQPSLNHLLLILGVVCFYFISSEIIKLLYYKAFSDNE